MKTKEKKGTKKIIPIILGIILLIGAIFGTKEYLYMRNHEDTDDAQIDGDINPVVARVEGYVDEINFEENEPVTSGQLLVKLDDRNLKIKLEQVLAAQRGAKATIGVSRSQISTTAAASETAKANVEASQVRLRQANTDYERYANLIKDGAITQQQFDQARTERDAARAEYDAVRQQYQTALRTVGTSRSQLAVTNTSADQRQADVDFAKLQASYAAIYAPVSGIVSKKTIQKGQLVQAGQTLFSIVNTNNLYVTANFKETQLKDLHEGEKVEIQVDAYPDQEVEGEIYNFSPATGAKFSLLPPDNATGNYVKVVQRVPVKIKIKAGKELMAKLRPGMSVKVSVLTN